MRGQVAGLHLEMKTGADLLEGVFLVRVDRAVYRCHPGKPFFEVRFVVLEPKDHAARTISGRPYCTQRALWKLNWFLRDFDYDTDLLGRDEVDERSVLGLTGVIRTSPRILPGRSFLNLEGFAPAAEWEELTPGASTGSALERHAI